MTRIITKILLSILLCSVLVGVSIGFLGVLQASRILSQEAREKFSYVSRNYANRFSATLEHVQGAVDTLASVVTSSFNLEKFTGDKGFRTAYMAGLGSMLKEMGERREGIQGIYIIINPELTGQVFQSWFVNDGTGTFISQTSEPLSVFFPENQDLAWYYAPIREKKGVWLPPYVDATIKVKMISYTRPIFRNGLLIGVAGIDLAFDAIEKTIGEMTLYESGYAFLINTDLTVILHPFLETGTDISRIANEDLHKVVASMTENRSGVIDYLFRNQEKIMGFAKLSNGWILGVSAVFREILTPVDRLRDQMTVGVVLLLIVTAIIGLFISRSITAPISRLRDLAALISQGRHDIELDLNSKSEVGELSKSIQVMTRKLVASYEGLKESEAKFRALAETSPLAIYMYENNGQKALYINPTFIRLFGYTMAEVPTLGHWWPLAYPDPEYRRKVCDQWQEKMRKADGPQPEIESREVEVICRDGSKKVISWRGITLGEQNWAFGLNLTERIQAEEKTRATIEALQRSLEEINRLRGILPICSQCKKIRNDQGYYEQIESYIQKHSEAVFSHGICPQCSDALYGDKDWYVEMKKKKACDRQEQDLDSKPRDL